jgi:hypothetical protein
MKEKWRILIGYEKFYEVSNLGQIRNLPRKILMPNGGYYISKKSINKQVENGKGYLRVFLCKNGIVTTKYVHRLVAITWCRNEFNYNEVNHIDGDKSNNIASNLEWVTRKQNVIHARKTGLAPSKLNETYVDEIIGLKNNGAKIKEIALIYGISHHTIHSIMSGNIWNWYTGIKERGCHYEHKTTKGKERVNTTASC